MNELTLLVFLKDRHNFTERLCRYLSAVQYPYHVYFADGSLEDENELFFKQLKNEKFSYSYHRYPKDSSLSDFYQKCYKAAQEIKTRYVMLADNDDFPIPEGQKKAIEFLDKNLDFIGCNGRIAGVELYSDSSVPYQKYFLSYKYYCTMDVPLNLTQNLAMGRISAYLSRPYSIYYSIFRTEHIVDVFYLIKKLNFSVLGFYEVFFSMMRLVKGKIYNIEHLTYVRQKGSSQSAISQKDWFYRLFYENWLEDCKNTIKVVSKKISKFEKLNYDAIHNSLYEKVIFAIREKYIPNNIWYVLKILKFGFCKTSILILIMTKCFNKIPLLIDEISFRVFIKNEFVDSLNIMRLIIKGEQN